MKKVLMITLMAMSAALWAAPVPVSHWTFDGNVNDSGSLANHGTIVGNPQYVPGRVGQAIQFDGNGDGVLIPTPSDYLSTTFSVSFWIKIPEGVRPQGIVMGKIFQNYVRAEAARGWGWSFMFDTAIEDWAGENLMMWGWSSGGRLAFTPSYYDTVRGGKWHHIVAVVNAGANSIVLYIDGVSFGSPIAPGSSGITADIVTGSLVAAQPLAFGYLPNGSSNWDWEGILDDVQYFDFALTSTDVADILAAAGGGCLGLLGDANADCEVNIYDLALVAQDWLKSGFYTEQ